MRKTTSGLLSLALATGLGATLTVPIAAATATPSKTHGSFGDAQTAAPSDSLPDPIADKQSELRKTAVASVLKGEAKPERIGNSTVVKVGEAERAATAAKGSKKAQKAKKVDQYVELAREDTDELFVLVVQFGNERHPNYPDVRTPTRTSPAPPRWNGPLFNKIPEPNRAVDNSTDWYADYGKAYYQDLYFGDGSVTGRESMRQYYERQSSGRYSIAGMVTDPVKVQYNEARYGRSDGFPCASNVCSNTWALVRDGMNAWVAPADRGRARRRPRSPTSSTTTTSGTATTGTATATSTSPTATSTTCRSCTPVATRPTVTRSRARTPSGRTAGAPSRAPTRPRRSRRWAAPRSAPPASGPPTTPCSPRTVACRSSPTSSVTTSACPTTTTPPGPPRATRTRSTGGP